MSGEMLSIVIYCKGCGGVVGCDNSVPVPDHCEQCPPWLCDQCGAMDSMQAPCVCWSAVADIPLAELKYFMADSGLNIDQDGKLSS